MRRRGRRELSIFNHSFLDVLCSGLGGVVTLLLLAFQTGAEKEAVEGQYVAAGLAVAQARAEADRLNDELGKLAGEVAVARRKSGAAGQAVKALEERQKQLLRMIDFMGVQTDKRKILLLVDLSASMDQPAGDKGSYGDVLISACGELIRRFRHGDDGRSTFAFNILTFQGTEEAPELRYWKPDGQLHEATEANKAEAQTHVEGFKGRFGGYTPTLKAFEKAFAEVRGLEAVVLLTDGAPNGASPDDATSLGVVVNRILALKPAGVEIKVVGIGPLLYRHPPLVNALIDLCDPSGVGRPGARRGKGSFIGL